MRREVYDAGVLREAWDTDTRLHTTYDESGVQVTSVAFTDAENAEADRLLAIEAYRAVVAARNAAIDAAVSELLDSIKPGALSLQTSMADLNTAALAFPTATQWGPSEQAAITGAVAQLAAAVRDTLGALATIAQDVAWLGQEARNSVEAP